MSRLVSLLLVLLLAACGGDGPAPGGQDPDGTDDPAATDDTGDDMADGDPDQPDTPLDPDVPVDPDGPIDEHAQTWTLVEPTPGMQDVRPRPWESHQVLDEPRIRILYWSGVEPCYVLDRVEVKETDDSVTVTLYEGHEPTEDGTPPVCPEIARYTGTDVTLDAPLGDRDLVDGASERLTPLG